MLTTMLVLFLRKHWRKIKEWITMERVILILCLASLSYFFVAVFKIISGYG